MCTVPPLRRGQTPEGQPISISRALVSLLLAMTMTGANVPLAKAIVAELPLSGFLVFRFALASAALVLFARGEDGPGIASARPAQIRDMVVMALFGMVGYTLLILAGLQRTSASDAGIITATLPAVVALLGALFLSDRLRLPHLCAIAVAVGGLALLQRHAAGDRASSLTGNLMIGGAVLCEAVFVVTGKRLIPPFRPFTLALWTNLAGLMLSLPLLLLDLQALSRIALTTQQWALVVWYVLSSSVLCLWLWYRGLSSVPTWLAGLATAALPIAASMVRPTAPVS